MADAYTTFAVAAVDAPNVYIHAKMIDLLQRILVLQKLADQFTLEQKMGKTLRVVRVERLALPNAQLVEGVTPFTNALTLTNVDTVVEQWGIVAAFTDVLELTTKHPIFSIGIERVSLAMKETMEREDANVLMAATNLTYPGAVTSRATLANTDVMNTAMIITINAKLEMRGAIKYMPDGYYMGVMQPPHKAAVLGSDTTFQNASAFSRIAKLEYGYIGPWMGVDWVTGNFMPFYVGVAAPDASAITATKGQITAGSGGSLAAGNYQFKVVAREISTDYERRISVQSASIAVGATGTVVLRSPSSTGYTYDWYMSQIGGTTTYLVASRTAASANTTISVQPVGTEAVGPASPALGINVYPGFVCGKGAFGTCTLNGMALQTFITPKGPTDSDPIAQRRKVGAKFMRKSFILDNAFIERFETGSALAPPLAA